MARFPQGSPPLALFRLTTLIQGANSVSDCRSLYFCNLISQSNAIAILCHKLATSSCLSAATMDAEEFRGQAKKLVDFIADYHLNHSDRSPLASDQPLEVRRRTEEKLRFLAEPPEAPMRWDDVMQHFVTYVFPGVSPSPLPLFSSRVLLNFAS